MSDTRHLEESMSDLRAQIAALHPDDEATRSHLTGLMDNVERRIGASADAPAEDDLPASLNASVLQFEASHPKISILLNQLAEKLGTMGI